METQKIKPIASMEFSHKEHVREIVTTVHQALQEKGYNPVTQLVGYILSGDPTYITGHQNARSSITKLERDELLEEIVRFYLTENDG